MNVPLSWRGGIILKNTGIARKVDELGRIVLPIELRKALDINEKTDSLEIYVEDGRIILEKLYPKCTFCGSKEELEDFKGKKICAACLADLKK